jgi:hypothetical protein
MNSINGALLSIIMSKDLPDDLKRTNLITGMMLGDNQNALFAQVLNIKQQKESQERIDELETRTKDCRISDFDLYIVKTVNEYIARTKDTRKEDLAQVIHPLLADYIKAFHNGILPREFQNLNPIVLTLLESTTGIQVPEGVNGMSHSSKTVGVH